MIKGFERETYELTSYEERMVPAMVLGLQTKIGVENAITNQAMAEGMSKMGYKSSSPRIRKLIHFIRVKKLVRNLVATSKGYYIENEPFKLKEYIYSLEQRIRSIQEIVEALNEEQTEKL